MRKLLNVLCDFIELFMTIVFGVKIWTLIEAGPSILDTVGIFSMAFLGVLFVIDIANDISNDLYRLAER